jgi:lichenan operon transcriptional antiterminator
MNQQVKQPIILSKAGKGYELTSLAMNIETPVKEDVRFLLLSQMIEKQSVDIFDLADSLYVSESTLDRLVKELNIVITEQDKQLLIKRKNNQLFIKGEEVEKRKLFNIFLNQEIETNKLSLDKYSNYFKFCDLRQLSEVIITFHEENNMYLNDYSTISFVLHIAVLIERVANGSVLPESKSNIQENLSDRMAVALIARLKDQLGILLPENEIPYIKRLYLGKLYKEGTEEAYLTKFVDDILEKVHQLYRIDFSTDEQFKNYLTLHLSGLYTRGTQGRYLTNPLIEEMKGKFPFIYNISVYVAALVQEELAIIFPDDEIAYIALHFLSASETLNRGKKKKVVVVCPYGIASQRIIQKKLSKITDYTIEIVKFVSALQMSLCDDADIDLIITSESLEKNSKTPIFKYSSFLTDEDIVQIEKIFLRQEKTLTVLDTFFKRELFFPNMNFETRKEVIAFLCEQLSDKNYCEPDYYEKVWKREMLSSTSYGNYFAIPHAIKRCAKRNAVSICCLDKAIDWDGKKVKLVLLLSLKEEREDMFEELFVQLVDMLDEVRFVKKLSRQQSFESFIKLCQSSIEMTE